MALRPIKISFTVFFACFCCSSYAKERTDSASHDRNIISASPFLFTENGPGFGAAYERAVDKKGSFAFYIPVAVTFNVANSNRIYDYNTGNYKTGKADAVFYAMPGLKFYPAGCDGKMKYSLGLAAIIASGQHSTNYADLNGLNVTEHIQSQFITGGMLINSLNINAGKNLYVGAELGLGCSFLNNVGGVTQNNEFLIFGIFKVGYRF